MATTNQNRVKWTMRGTVTTNAFTQQMDPDRKILSTRMIGIDGQPVNDVPYITANSARGLLRRAASDVIYDECKRIVDISYADASLVKLMNETGTPLPGMISRDLWLSVCRGAYGRTVIAAGGSTFQQARATRDHLFAGIFGGGALIHESRFRFENSLFPMLRCVANIFPAEVHGSLIDATPRDIVADTIMAPRDDFMRMPKHSEVIADFERDYNAHQATKIDQREAARAAKSEGGSASKDDLAGFNTIQAIIPGVPLYFSMAASQAITLGQLGLLITGLHSWVNRNALGGGSSRGFGSFTPDIKLTLNGSNDPIQLFHGSAPEVQLTDNEFVRECIQHMKNELAGAVQELATVYPSSAVSAVKVTPAAKKAAKLAATA